MPLVMGIELSNTRIKFGFKSYAFLFFILQEKALDFTIRVHLLIQRILEGNGGQILFKSLITYKEY